MAFGSGVLHLRGRLRARRRGLPRRRAGARPSLGFLVGAAVYTGADARLARRGAKHRKRSGGQQPSEQQAAGSGTALAVGALLDGIPESAVIGVSLLGGRGVGVATVVAVFLSNLPEGLSSAAGMKRGGALGALRLRRLEHHRGAQRPAAVPGTPGGEALGDAGVAALTALAAGAILAMLTDTMVPEAVAGPGRGGRGHPRRHRAAGRAGLPARLRARTALTGSPAGRSRRTTLRA